MSYLRIARAGYLFKKRSTARAINVKSFVTGAVLFKAMYPRLRRIFILVFSAERSCSSWLRRWHAASSSRLAFRLLIIFCVSDVRRESCLIRLVVVETLFALF